MQPLAGREKRLLVADMDSTLIGQESVDELAALAGVGAHVAALTERAMQGDIAFEPALRKRVGLLARLPETAIDEALAKSITLNPGARTLVQTMKARGARVVVVSGGFRPFTRAVAARLGADEDRANELEIVGGKLTGRAIEPIQGGDAKRAALREIAGAMGLDLSETMAVGDGANDLAMLRVAGLGVAYHAKPRVAAAAHARDRPRRPDGAALCAGDQAEGFCGGVMDRRPLRCGGRTGSGSSAEQFCQSRRCTVMTVQTVLISGAGIAGPTLAYWLKAAGFQPTLIERAPALRTGGYVIDFWGLGYDIAERMGLTEGIKSVGYHVQELRIVGDDGRRQAGFGTKVFEELTGGRYVTIGRSDLSRLLFEKAALGTEAIFGEEIACLDERADGVHVRLKHGGERHFDLIVGADGLHSDVRRLAFGPENQFEKRLGYSVAAFTADNYRPRDEDVYLMYGQPGRMLGRFTLRDDRTLFLFVFADDNSRSAHDARPAEGDVARQVPRRKMGMPANPRRTGSRP